MARELITVGEGRGPDNDPCVIALEIESGLITGVQVDQYRRGRFHFIRLYNNVNYTGDVLESIERTRKGGKDDR